MIRLNSYQSNPLAMKALGALEEHIHASELEKPLIELVRLRASQINGCAFCVDLHSSQALRAGEKERRITTLSVWSETPFFTERERAALAWTEALTRVEQTHVPDDVWEAVKSQFTAAEIVDLTLLVGTINVWNRFGIAFRAAPK